MDATQVAILVGFVGVLGTLAGSLIGVSVAEYFASRREASARVHAAAVAEANRVRADLLEAIDQTHRGSVAALNRLIAVASGDANASTIPVGVHTYPRLNVLLINDVNTQRAYTAICAELMSMKPGTLSPQDLVRVATVETSISHLLEQQRKRALRDEPILELDLAEFMKHPEFANAYSAMGIPPDPNASTTD